MAILSRVLTLAIVRDMCRSGSARALREQHSLSLGEVAAAIGATPGAISRWETGDTRPRNTGAFAAYSELLGELVALDTEPADHEDQPK